MRSVYEEERIPLQIRRLMIFSEICKLAKKKPDEIVYLSPEVRLAFSVIYFEKSKKYVAYGGVFKYAHTRQEVIEQGLDKLTYDEYIMCAITVQRQAFTRATRTPLGLLIHWNKHVKNRPCNYVCGDTNTFFPVNDELEKDYLPHEYHKHLLAIKNLPLWDNHKA